MSKGTVLALGLGIVIGAAGMWFVDNSNQPTYQVDEVIEGYSMPTPSSNQAEPVNPPAVQAPADTMHPAPADAQAPAHGNMDNTAPAEPAVQQ